MNGAEMREELDRLRTIAEMATQSPWAYDGHSGIFATTKIQTYDNIEMPECERPEWKRQGGWSCQESGPCSGCPYFEASYNHDPLIAGVPPHHGDVATDQHLVDAQYIATFDPPTTLALLALLDTVMADRDALAQRLRETVQTKS